MSAKRTIKDSVFRHLMKNPKYIPELHHALTNEPIDNIQSIRLNTLTGVMVDACRNDLSYIIDGKTVILSEHQSTINENMPLRFLIYVARTYERYFNREMFYRKKIQQVFSPHFFSLYNGTDSAPLKEELKLSKAFMLPSSDLELIVTVYNINYDSNNPILNLSPILCEYSFFMHKIRVNQQEMLYNQAVKEAVAYCIKHGILEEFLRKHESEVLDMAQWKYDHETAMKVVREEGIEEGMEKGIEKGRNAERTLFLADIAKRAKKMFQRGLSLEDVTDFTGLPASELKAIRAGLA